MWYDRCIEVFRFQENSHFAHARYPCRGPPLVKLDHKVNSLMIAQSFGRGRNRGKSNECIRKLISKGLDKRKCQDNISEKRGMEQKNISRAIHWITSET